LKYAQKPGAQSLAIIVADTLIHYAMPGSYAKRKEQVETRT